MAVAIISLIYGLTCWLQTFFLWKGWNRLTSLVYGLIVIFGTVLFIACLHTVKVLENLILSGKGNDYYTVYLKRDPYVTNCAMPIFGLTFVAFTLFFTQTIFGAIIFCCPTCFPSMSEYFENRNEGPIHKMFNDLDPNITSTTTINRDIIALLFWFKCCLWIYYSWFWKYLLNSIWHLRLCQYIYYVDDPACLPHFESRECCLFARS